MTELKLFEYEAKQIARKAGLPIPNGILVTKEEEIPEALANLKPPFVIKGQVLAACRMKAGGVLFASSKLDVELSARRLLGANIHDELVSNILIEEKISSKRELYVGISVNREKRCYLLLASTHGGSDIEEVATRDPSKIVRKNLDPLTGLSQSGAETIGRTLGYSEDRLQTLASTLARLHEVAAAYDAELVEANPMIETPTGQFVLADLKVIIDDNALFRHPEFSKRPERVEELTGTQLQAQRLNLSYEELHGNIGVMGNGAGLVMATLDLVAQYGGSPADFCDVGGGADTRRVESALEMLIESEQTDVVLVNILGGITRCDEVANGIVEAKNRAGEKKPLVVRLVGTFEDEGKKILKEASIPYGDSMDESAQEAVRLARRN